MSLTTSTQFLTATQYRTLTEVSTSTYSLERTTITDTATWAPSYPTSVSSPPTRSSPTTSGLGTSTLITIIVLCSLVFIAIAIAVSACFLSGMFKKRNSENIGNRGTWRTWAQRRGDGMPNQELDEVSARESSAAREQPIWVEMIGGYFAPGRRERMRSAWNSGGGDSNSNVNTTQSTEPGVTTPGETKQMFRYA